MYLETASAVDPDELTNCDALAYWINLYNAGAISSAATAYDSAADSVLRIPGAFSRPWITVAGEALSLDDIEHGKIRRFRDPRIHGALVCGAISCPTLRRTPFTGAAIDSELEDQMRSFMAHGGGHLDRTANTVTFSRVLKWYGRDFVSPQDMPTILPARNGAILAAVSQWFGEDDRAFIRAETPGVRFSAYDWALGCSIT